MICKETQFIVFIFAAKLKSAKASERSCTRLYEVFRRWVFHKLTEDVGDQVSSHPTGGYEEPDNNVNDHAGREGVTNSRQQEQGGGQVYRRLTANTVDGYKR